MNRHRLGGLRPEGYPGIKVARDPVNFARQSKHWLSPAGGIFGGKGRAGAVESGIEPTPYEVLEPARCVPDSHLTDGQAASI